MAQSKKVPRSSIREREPRSRQQSSKQSALRRWLSLDEPPPAGQITFRDYVVMNAVFTAFCIVQLLIVRFLLRDFVGLYFFFGFIICAFLLVSIFDYFSEKLNMGVSAGENTDITND